MHGVLRLEFPNHDDLAVPNIDQFYSAFTFREEDKKEALKVALSIFEDLTECQFTNPSHLTFGTMIKAINNLYENNQEKERLIINIFKQCCSAGQLGSFVLRCLQDAVSSEIYLKLLRGDRSGVVSINAEDLPKEWKENVRERASPSRNWYVRQKHRSKSPKYKRIQSNRKSA